MPSAGANWGWAGMLRHKRTHSGVKRGFYSGRVGYGRHLFVRLVYLAVDLLALGPIALITVVSRMFSRPIDVGIGPTPTINSRYHKRALEHYGYSCETFVYHTWYFTTEFDVMFNKWCPRALGPYVSYLFCLFRYKCLYIYFAGGPLGFTTLLARLEPFLLRVAGIKTVVMPFGADVQVLTRAKNKLFVHASSIDYPGNRLTVGRTAALVDTWTKSADHVISGCDWVDYMFYWDTLTLAHFCIDVGAIQPAPEVAPADPPGALRIAHAPNHRALKGTDHIIGAVNELRAEGASIELTVLEGLPNETLIQKIREADVVIDQLVIGWYAMFALESMALAKPVVCYIRADLEELYVAAGLLSFGELPLIKATTRTIKDVLQKLTHTSRDELRQIGANSRSFVERHHSVQAIGRIFDRINTSIDLLPSVDP